MVLYKCKIVIRLLGYSKGSFLVSEALFHCCSVKYRIVLKYKLTLQIKISNLFKLFVPLR